MLKRPRRTAALAIAAVAAFMTTTVALGAFNTERAPKSLSYVDRPIAHLSHAATINLNDRITPAAAAEFGVSQASFAQARSLAETGLGNLLLLPGSSGQCLGLGDSVACGHLDNKPGNSSVILLREDPATGMMVGGGVVNQATKSVSVQESSNGVVHTFPVTNGYFVVTAADGIAARHTTGPLAGEQPTHWLAFATS